jgi:hypothetical protein
MDDRLNRVPLAFLAIALLIVVSQACSPTGALPSGGAQGQPTQPPVAQATSQGSQQPTTPLKPTATTAASSGLKFAKPDDLNSYRARLTMSTKKKEGSTSGDMTMTIEYVKEPPSRHVVMGKDTEVITIKDTTWVKVMGKWVQQSASQQNKSQTPDSLLPQEDITVKELGVETVNGIRCKHYNLSGKVTITIPAASSRPERKASVKVQGEAWIADQAGLPQVAIRQRMEMEGSLSSLATSTATPRRLSPPSRLPHLQLPAVSKPRLCHSKL